MTPKHIVQVDLYTTLVAPAIKRAIDSEIELARAIEEIERLNFLIRDMNRELLSRARLITRMQSGLTVQRNNKGRKKLLTKKYE